MFLLLTCSFVTRSEASDIDESELERMDYRPFVEDGKQWVVASTSYPMQWVEWYYIGSDTIIGIQPCKKLLRRTWNYQTDKAVWDMYAYIFETERRVYYYPAESVVPSEPILLYDFNATGGDTLTLGGQRSDIGDSCSYRVWRRIIWDYTFGDVYTGKYRGLLATVADSAYTEADINKEHPTTTMKYRWFEGIGSEIHPFKKYAWNESLRGISSRLRECRVGDEVLYLNTVGGNLPLPVTNITISGQNGESDRIHDLQGRRLAAPPKKGVYIENGRKRVAK